jgi:glycogen operon protein
MAGDAIDEMDELGNAITDDTILVLLNAYDKAVQFVLPSQHQGRQWTVVLDSREVAPEKQVVQKETRGLFTLVDRSLAILSCCESGNKKPD